MYVNRRQKEVLERDSGREAICPGGYSVLRAPYVHTWHGPLEF